MRDVAPNRRLRNQLSSLRSEGRLYPILAYDVETDDKGRFMCAHVYGERWIREGHKKVKTTLLIDEACSTQEELTEVLLRHDDPKIRVPYILVAYNFKYDLPYILKITRDEKVLWGTAGFISGRLINGAHMIDLTNHTQKRSLEEMIEIMGIEGIKKYPLNPDPTQRQERCRDDARATYELGKHLQAFYYDIWKVDLAPTIASQAMKIFRACYFDHSFFREGFECQFNTLERKAYYGGRTECFRRGVYTVHSFDVKSMYPSVMVGDRIPDPTSAKMMANGKKYREYFDTDEAGIYHVRVFVPRQNVGLLPYRNKDGQLTFPWGIVEGWYLKEELKAAEQYGAKILTCHAFVRYTRRIDLFTGYITEMFNRRKEFPSGTLYNLMFKILMNSLYGKFGQKNPVGAFTGKMDDYCGDLNGERPIPSWSVMDEECINVSATHYEEAYSAFPIVAAYITAMARVRLLHKIMEHRSTIVYCDTDSVKYLVSDSKDESGSQIGEWEYEYTSTQIFIRPKLYYNENLTALKMKGVKMGKYPPLVWTRLPTEEEDMQTIEHFDKNGVLCRIPLAQVTVIAIQENGILARFYKPTGLKEGINRELPINEWRRHVKQLDWSDTKRSWEIPAEFIEEINGIPNSVSYPPYVGFAYRECWLKRYCKAHQSHRERSIAWGRIESSEPDSGHNSSLPPVSDQLISPQSARPSPPDISPDDPEPLREPCSHTDSRGSGESGCRRSAPAETLAESRLPASSTEASHTRRDGSASSRSCDSRNRSVLHRCRPTLSEASPSLPQTPPSPDIWSDTSVESLTESWRRSRAPALLLQPVC